MSSVPRSVVAGAKPLDNFPLAHTTNSEKVREALARVYAQPTLQFGRGSKMLNARLNECRLQNVRLAYGNYGGAVCLNFPAVDCFLQLLPLKGKGEIISKHQPVSLVAATTSATISPDAGYQANYSADYEGLVLKLDSRILTKKLAAMTGATIHTPLMMDLQQNCTQSALTLRQYLPVLANILSDAVAPLPAWWVSQTEQLLMVMFLCGHKHNYSHLLEREAPDSAPWQVRKAEDYIEANWRETVTLEDLAKLTGVSAFSLFRSFKKARGYSPWDFVSQVRSRHLESS
jgi:hypothetical protein